MKRIFSMLLILAILCSFMSAVPACAIGDGNIDGGGGDMGGGTNTDFWSPGNEGVRVTVVRSSDRSVVTTPIDLTNKNPDNIDFHFGKLCKLSYTGGRSLSSAGVKYNYINPAQALPQIISIDGSNNIDAIKSYFTDEQVIRSLADITGMSFDVLINGEYRLLIEPVAYYMFQGVMIATTATEAALYDEQVSGLLRQKMIDLTHKNMPLAMFLEVADLGYPAWAGSRTRYVSNTDIKAFLGLGIVRFNNVPAEPPAVTAYDYEYRVNTEVITSVTVSGGQSDPDNPVTVTFRVSGRNMRVENVYYPEGESQLVWIRWTTPATPQTMDIPVTVSGSGSVSKATITVSIVDLSGNGPPNPVADDRNDSYFRPSVPGKVQKESASWSIWRPWWQEHWVWHSDWNWYSDGKGGGHWEDDGEWVDEGWWKFDLDRYQANLLASMEINPDDKAPSASGKTMKSGYGINQTVTANVSTNQSSAVTDAQNAVTFFPEFQYKDFWRLLERTSEGYNSRFKFRENSYSTYSRRTHFTPIWFPDGSYTPYTWLMDCWTPAGMLSMDLTDSVTIQGNLWTNWHISPQKPD